MSKQHTVMQLLAKYNIILDQDSITMIKDNNPEKEYYCSKHTKSKGFTLLHKLVMISNKYLSLSDVIKEYILLYPEEVNKVNEKGWSALLLAVSNEVLEIVKLLVEHNASINVKKNNGVTALMYASYNATESSHEVVKLLVEHNADVNVKNIGGMTSLMYTSYSATESSPKIIKLLLKHNVDVNVKSDDGMTALRFASRKSTKLSSTLIKLLLEHDSAPYIKKLYVVKNIEILNAKN